MHGINHPQSCKFEHDDAKMLHITAIVFKMRLKKLRIKTSTLEFFIYRTRRKEMTVMGKDVSLPPRVNVITGFQLFHFNLIGKHSHFPLIIDYQVCQQQLDYQILDICVFLIS